jgi:hypothetical protein
MTHASALLDYLPQKNQASQDEDPEDNCFDRRIHEKTSFYCVSIKRTDHSGRNLALHRERSLQL